MEITDGIKVQVFTQYFGQRFKSNAGSFNFEKIQSSGELDFGYTINEVKLILKPLSKITDEDAIEVSKMMGYDDLKTVVRDNAGNFLFICEKTTGKKKIYAEGSSIDLLESNTLWWDENNGSDGHSSECGEVSLFCYQYLQSKGYDLPHYLLGGKTLFECGLAVYE